MLIGALIGLATSPSRRTIAAVIAFGSGVLVSALTFALMQEAAERGNLAFASGGFLVGAVGYVATGWLLDRLAARSPKRSGRQPRDVEPGVGVAAVLPIAGGGILAILADTMMPEAIENGGPLVALATALGFLCAFLLSHLAF